MSVFCIEIHDAGLRAVHEAHPTLVVVPPSPGFALLDGDDLLTGMQAFRRFRLMPRRTANRFWERLDTSKLPRPFPRRLTHADLVHAHLKNLWGSVQSVVDDVILAVPGWYSDEQLGLLLGIARACDLPVHGMVDSAVAASSTVKAEGAIITMDLHLHRIAATTLRGGTDLHRRSIEVHPGMSLIALWDVWVKLVAELFVRKTRFDPLHRAETEQGLYLSLPQWLDRLRDQESTRLVIDEGGKKYAIELERRDLIDRARPQYNELDRLMTSLKGTDDEATLLLSHNLNRLPGLVDHVSDRLPVIELPPNAVATGALAAKDSILDTKGSEELAFITQLPLSVPDKENPPSLVPAATPTHILRDGTAWPISSKPFPIDESGSVIRRRGDRVVAEDKSDAGTFVNESKIDGPTALHTGDRVRVGPSGEDLQLIHVKE